MDLLLATAIFFATLVALAGLSRGWQARARARGARLPEGESLRRQARRVPARVFVERAVKGGPKAGGYTSSPADLSLGEHTFVVANGRGRVLVLGPGRPGEARAAGPQRLVVEGLLPGHEVKVRVELLVEAVEAWAADINGLLTDR